MEYILKIQNEMRSIASVLDKHLQKNFCIDSFKVDVYCFVYELRFQIANMIFGQEQTSDKNRKDFFETEYQISKHKFLKIENLQHNGIDSFVCEIILYNRKKIDLMEICLNEEEGEFFFTVNLNIDYYNVQKNEKESFYRARNSSMEPIVPIVKEFECEFSEYWTALMENRFVFVGISKHNQ